MPQFQLPPGSLGLPYLGETCQFIHNRMFFLQHRFQEHGPIFKTKLYGTPTIVVDAPEPARFMLITHADNFEVKNRGVADIFGNAIFMLKGQQHLQHRQILNSMLTGDILDSYIPNMLELVKKSTTHWLKSQKVNLYQEMLEITLRMCSQILLGIDNEHLHSIFIQAFNDFRKGTLATYKFKAPRSAYQHGISGSLNLKQLIYHQIQEKRASPTQDVLSNLISNNASNKVFMSDSQIADHMLALMVAARETTASLAVWLVFEIVSNQYFFKRVREDAKKIFYENNVLTFKILKSPLFTAAILKEAERYHSPNVISMRDIVTECSWNQYMFPVGWQAAYSPSASHFKAKSYADPFTFNPERYLRTSANMAIESGQLLTFGLGKHSCLGGLFAEAQILCIVYILLSHFDLYVESGAFVQAAYKVNKYPKNDIIVNVANYSK